jgi:flagellar hook-associated protein 1 FlgK
VSGLRAVQAGLDVVSQNVANSGSVGYTRRELTTTELTAGDRSGGVRVGAAERVLDKLLQRQLRLEAAGAAYTSLKSGTHTALDKLFDAPGGAGALSTLVDNFTSSLGTLSNNPSSYSGRIAVLTAADELAGTLNDLSGQVQALRQNAEDGLAVGVSKANDLLRQIASLNGALSLNSSAALEDERDGLIDKLASLVDLKVTAQRTGTVSITTTAGLPLVEGTGYTTLSFDARSPVSAQSVYDRDPAKRSLGTITATDQAGNKMDVIASKLIRSGELAAQIELRDDVLAQAQRQLDELAGGLASALSDKQVAGVPASAAGQDGFDVDLAGLLAGNAVTLDVTRSGAAERLKFVRVDSAGSLPLPEDDGTGARVVGIDFSGGPASVASQIGTALGAGFTVTNPGGSTLRILDDGAAGTSGVAALSANRTVTALAGGDPELALFVDRGGPSSTYTGSFAAGSQLVGFSGRIGLNPLVRSDPSTLVKYAATTPAGDDTRPARILDAVASARRTFSGAARIGGSDGPYTASIADFASRIVETQANAANSAKALDEGQTVVLNAIQSRYSEKAGVNVEAELAQLIQLQTAYGANARVMSAARDMLDLLLRVGQ